MAGSFEGGGFAAALAALIASSPFWSFPATSFLASLAWTLVSRAFRSAALILAIPALVAGE